MKLPIDIDGVALFKATTQYTFQDFLALNRMMSKTYRKWSSLIVCTWLGIAGAIFTAISILMLIDEGFGWDWLFCLIVGVAFIIISIFKNYIGALQSKYMTIQEIGVIHYIFQDDQLFIDCDKEKSMIAYTALHSIFRYKDRYFLCLDKRHAYVLTRSSFAVDNTDEFEKFLSEKTGREWNRLNTGRKKERLMKDRER